MLKCYFLTLGPWSSGKQPWINLRETPTHSEERKTNLQHFRGKSSCERNERYFFNATLQIQLHKNWPYMQFLSKMAPKIREKIILHVPCWRNKFLLSNIGYYISEEE